MVRFDRRAAACREDIIFPVYEQHQNTQFDWKVFEKEEQRMKHKKLARLQNLAAAMNYQLIPNP
jgi:hypothetical protein